MLLQCKQLHQCLRAAFKTGKRAVILGTIHPAYIIGITDILVCQSVHPGAAAPNGSISEKWLVSHSPTYDEGRVKGRNWGIAQAALRTASQAA